MMHVAYSGRDRDERLDCAVRAHSIAFNIPYSEAHALFKSLGRRNRCRTKSTVTMEAIRKSGVELKNVRRTGSVLRFLRDFPSGRFLVKVRGHIFAVIDGRIWDDHNPETNENKHVKAAWQIA